MSDYVPNSSCYERMPHWFVCWGWAEDWMMTYAYETPPAGWSFVVYNSFLQTDYIPKPFFAQNSEIPAYVNPEQYPYEYEPTSYLPNVPSDAFEYSSYNGEGLFNKRLFAPLYTDSSTYKNYTERLATSVITRDPDGNYSGVDWSYCDNLNKVNLSRGPQQATAKVIFQNQEGTKPDGITADSWFEYSDGFVSESPDETGHGDIYYYFATGIASSGTGLNVLNIGNGGTTYPLGYSAPLGTFKFVDCHTAEFPKSHMQYDIYESRFGPYTYSKNIQHGHDLVNLVHVEELTYDFPNFAPWPYIEMALFYGSFGNLLTYDTVSNFGFDIKLDDQFKL